MTYNETKYLASKEAKDRIINTLETFDHSTDQLKRIEEILNE